MNLGRYEIETYYVIVNSQTETRQRIIYTGLNQEDIFIERYYGTIRSGYKGSNTFFKNLSWTNIKSHIVGESIVINDNSNPPKPQIYLSISSIESIQRDDDVTLVIVDSQIEPISLEFISPFDCDQSYSLFSYLLQNSELDIDSISFDIDPPTVFFNEYFFGEKIMLNGSLASGPFSSEDGDSFKVDINLSDFEGPIPISKSELITGLVYDITDNRDGDINLTENDISIYKDVININNLVNQISESGVYLCKFHLHDLGQNQNSSTVVFAVI